MNNAAADAASVLVMRALARRPPPARPRPRPPARRGGIAPRAADADAQTASPPPSPEPDAAAAANLLLTMGAAAAVGAAIGVDAWSADRGAGYDSLSPVVWGLACAVPHTAFLLTVRSSLGGVWWSRIEGQDGLGTLAPLRAGVWALCIALADGTWLRGLTLNAACGYLAGGTETGTGIDALSPADAALVAAAGTLVPHAPLPPSWFTPFLAIAIGGVAVAVSSWEAPPLLSDMSSLGADAEADVPLADGAAPPALTWREYVWSLWGEDGEVSALMEPTVAPGEGGGDGRDGDAAGFTLALAAPLPASVRRWPPGADDDVVRALVVPTLVAVEAAALAWETLASASLFASVLTHALTLTLLAALERADAKQAGAGEGGG